MNRGADSGPPPPRQCQKRPKPGDEGDDGLKEPSSESGEPRQEPPDGGRGKSKPSPRESDKSEKGNGGKHRHRDAPAEKSNDEFRSITDLNHFASAVACLKLPLIRVDDHEHPLAKLTPEDQ